MPTTRSPEGERTARLPRVLVFVHYYIPGFKSGGPLRTIANLVDALGDEFEFRIVAADRDALDVSPYASVTPEVWCPVGNALVYYVSPQQQRLRSIARLMRETPHDLLYINSYFDWFSTVIPLAARALGLVPRRPTVVAPRGEFAASALALKARKKQVYMLVAKAIGLYRGVVWQASSEYEAQDIRRIIESKAAQVVVASDLPTRVHHLTQSVSSAPPGRSLRLLFLSRISPMKNLDFALSALAMVEAPVEFSIYGPVRDEAYWNECRAISRGLPPHIKVEYRGVVDPDRVGSVMSAHDLLFLPTRGENYGHVIAEALSAGTPVLISDETPWRGLADAHAGWDLPLDAPREFAQRITDCARMTDEERALWRQDVLRYAESRLDDPSAVEANRRMFMDALGRA